jgi:Flp pilus assembly protein TadG
MKRRRSRGGAMLELAILSPWIVFLFIGVFDMGFYAYSMITLETATRSAAAWNSAAASIDAAKACTIALDEMQTLINMSGVTTCSGGSPVRAAATAVTGPDAEAAVRVDVTYTTPQLIPIPGLIKGQFTITRSVTMKL